MWRGGERGVWGYSKQLGKLKQDDACMHVVKAIKAGGGAHWHPPARSYRYGGLQEQAGHPLPKACASSRRVCRGRGSSSLLHLLLHEGAKGGGEAAQGPRPNGCVPVKRT